MVREEVHRKIMSVKRMAAYYRSLGADPLSLAAGCAVKVDLVRVVYPAMEMLRPLLRGLGIEIAEREDADVFVGDFGSLEIARAFLPLGKEGDPGVKVRGPARAAVLVQVHQMNSNDPVKFARVLEPAYRSLARAAPSLRIGKGHSIVTPFREDEFMLADLVTSGRGEHSIGFNNDTMHIIDPSSDILDPRQVRGSLLNAMNDLFVIGMYRGLTVLPVINAPEEGLRDKLTGVARGLVAELGGRLIDVPPPRAGRLMMGATVVAYSDRRPPQFHDRVRPGMKLIATRPFGELAPITLYLTSVIDESLVDELEAEGLGFEELERMKEEAVNIIATPNRPAAEVIERHLSYVNEEYDPDEHIAATTDVTGPGAYVVYELAKLTKSTIRLYDFPLLFPEASELAARHFAMPNATAGTNGGFIIVAPETVADDIVKELSSRGLRPSIIGEVVSTGEARVVSEVDLSKYIFDEEVLRALGQGREVGGGVCEN
ncbi:MAG: SelD-related putative sulfur metabolism protein [Acidilobus sp.]